MNAKKLHDELIAAGITDVVTVVSDGRVIDDNKKEIQSRPDVAAVLAAHDPTETPAPSLEERLAATEDALLAITLGGL